LIGVAALVAAAGCTTGDTPPAFSPDRTAERIDQGFVRDLGVGATMGHSVPTEGEVISTPACVPEARAGQECRD
jgi:hypothetical protein